MQEAYSEKANTFISLLRKSQTQNAGHIHLNRVVVNNSRKHYIVFRTDSIQARTGAIKFSQTSVFANNSITFDSPTL